MPSSLNIPDLHELLAADGTLHLDLPQTAADVSAAVAKALEAVKQAYRVAYSHAGGDDENEIVDGLDMTAHWLLGIAADLK